MLQAIEQASVRGRRRLGRTHRRQIRVHPQQLQQAREVGGQPLGARHAQLDGLLEGVEGGLGLSGQRQAAGQVVDPLPVAVVVSQARAQQSGALRVLAAPVGLHAGGAVALELGRILRCGERCNREERGGED